MTQKGRKEGGREGSKESKAKKQSKQIQHAEDLLNGLKLTVRVLVSAF